MRTFLKLTLTVAILLPLEMAFGILSVPALWLAAGLSDVGGPSLLSPVNAIVGPVAHSVLGLLESNGWLGLVGGAVVLFGAIRFMTSALRRLAEGASERAIHSYLVASPGSALVVGVLLTIMVQSSSITTSVVVPLVAAGIVSVRKIFPFVVGANIGTTITAMLAALALTGGSGGTGLAMLEVAFAHLCFNLFGAAIFIPFRTMREIPIKLATGLGNLVARSRAYALAYIGIVFFAIPIAIIATARGDLTDDPPEPPGTLQTAPADTLTSGGSDEH